MNKKTHAAIKIAKHNQVNKRAMNDPRAKRLIKEIMENPLADMKRMLYRGFSTIVKV